MPVYISNAAYVNLASITDDPNRSLIGWRSVFLPADLAVSYQVTGQSAVDANETAPNLWNADNSSFFDSGDVATGGAVTYCDIQINNSGLDSVDYLAVSGHNIATDAKYYAVQYSSDGGATWVNATSPTIPPNNNSIIAYFNMTSRPLWRLRIVHESGGTARFTVGHMRLGKITRLQRPMYVGMTPLSMDEKSTIVSNISDTGYYQGAILKSVNLNYSIDQMHNDPGFVRSEIVPMLKHIRLAPDAVGNGPKGSFFAAWRPDTYPSEVMYCHPGKIKNPENQLSNGMMSWSISGTGEK